MTAEYTMNIYEILFPVIKNEKQTKELVQNIEKVIDKKFDEKKELFISVDDKTKLLTKDDAYKIFGTKEDLKEQKSEVIKWMFIFWITQMISLFGFMLYFIKR